MQAAWARLTSEHGLACWRGAAGWSVRPSRCHGLLQNCFSADAKPACTHHPSWASRSSGTTAWRDSGWRQLPERQYSWQEEPALRVYGGWVGGMRTLGAVLRRPTWWHRCSRSPSLRLPSPTHPITLQPPTDTVATTLEWPTPPGRSTACSRCRWRMRDGGGTSRACWAPLSHWQLTCTRQRCAKKLPGSWCCGTCGRQRCGSRHSCVQRGEHAGMAGAWAVAHHHMQRPFTPATPPIPPPPQERAAEARLLSSMCGQSARDVRARLHVSSRSARLAFLPAFHLEYQHGEAFNAHDERIPARYEAIIGGTGGHRCRVPCGGVHRGAGPRQHALPTAAAWLPAHLTHESRRGRRGWHPQV